MLRYSSNNAKPVDYYRPLTVDVSVEYELPKEVAPPKGSAPLLIIHPSAYFRPKPTSNPSPVKPTTTGQIGPATMTTNRLGDIASTLYYLSTSGLPPPPTQNQPSKRYDPSTPPSKSTRSRTSAKGLTDEVSRPRGTLINSRVHGGGVIKKVGQTHQPQPVSYHHLDGSGSYPVPMETTSSFGPARQGGGGGTASNKRLRMTATGTTAPIYNSGGIVLEPLNLAQYNNQFSSFLSGYYPQNHFQPTHAQSTIASILKEGPVPVDKGSGSDSGVCSENDSDDVSPPMAPFISTTATSQTMSSSRRSNLQEFPNAGCYCCCCPTTSTSSIRKATNSKVKGHQTFNPPPPVTGTGGGLNYGNFLNVIHHLGSSGPDHLGGSGGIQPRGGSPMDSSAPPPLHHTRKWVSEGLNLPGPQIGSNYGKWYQV